MKNAGSLPQEERAFGKGTKDIPQRKKGYSTVEQRTSYEGTKGIPQEKRRLFTANDYGLFDYLNL